MKVPFIAFFLSVCFLSLRAQTYYDSTFSNIPDTSIIAIPVTIAGLPAKIDSAFGISSVCINITHTFIRDLYIELMSPDSTKIILTGGVGNNGKNFTNTCFAMNGADGPIASGTAPFTGTFIPQQSLNWLNNGQDPNGIWKLFISDTYFVDTGSYHNSKIVFSANPPPDPPIPPVICSYCSCDKGADTCDLLPDLTASALCIQQYHLEGPGNLQLSNATPNIGWGPLEVHAIDSCYCDSIPVSCSVNSCPSGNPVKHAIIQRIYHRAGSDTLSSYDRIAGFMQFHKFHGHLHVDHFADYTLRVSTPNPDPATWPIIGKGVKQSFCLMNLEDCTNAFGYCLDSIGNTLTVGSIPNAGFGLYSGCGVDQGIYPGMLDIYDMQYNDPIKFVNICNGNYYIVSITDPLNVFLEANENNNWAAVPVTLAQQSPALGAASFNYSINGTQVTFINTSPSGSAYLWNFGDGTWDTVYNPVHSYSAAGTYSVTLVSLDQCYSATMQAITVTGISEYSHSSLNLNIYQNPVTDYSYITYYIAERASIEINVLDILGGSTQFYFADSQNPGLHKVRIRDILPDLSSPGVYLLKLSVPGLGNGIVKIIKL